MHLGKCQGKAHLCFLFQFESVEGDRIAALTLAIVTGVLANAVTVSGIGSLSLVRLLSVDVLIVFASMRENISTECAI
jgi:hypothetical protein